MIHSMCFFLFLVFCLILDCSLLCISQNGSKEECEEMERPGAIISNHVSYLDILYHMSTWFPSFVAKVCRANLIILNCLLRLILPGALY